MFIKNNDNNKKNVFLYLSRIHISYVLIKRSYYFCIHLNLACRITP